MANFDYRVNETETEVRIKVATFDHGVVHCVLPKTQFSPQDMDNLTAIFSEGADPLNEAAMAAVDSKVQEAVALRDVQAQVCTVVLQNGPETIVNFLGTNPSGWFVEYCNANNISLNIQPK